MSSLELIHGSIIILHPGGAVSSDAQTYPPANNPPAADEYATQTAPRFDPQSTQEYSYDDTDPYSGGYDESGYDDFNGGDDDELGDVVEDEDEAYYRLETVDEGVYNILLRSEGYLQEVCAYSHAAALRGSE